MSHIKGPGPKVPENKPNPAMQKSLTVPKAGLAKTSPPAEPKQSSSLQSKLVKQSEPRALPMVSENSPTQDLYQKAHNLRAQGDMIGALHAFQEAAKAGTIEAKFWLGELDQDHTFPQSKTPVKPAVHLENPVEINQRLLLNKFADILWKLQKMNPIAYKQEVVDRIINELDSAGHCMGFAFYFDQLALLGQPEKYYSFMQKMLTWEGELFEPPKGFNYKIDIQKLKPILRERLAFTDEIKKVIQLIRFEQQGFHEAEEWGKPRDDTEVFKEAPTVPFHEHKNQNIEMILGEEFKISLRVKSLQPLGEMTVFLPTLKSNLNDHNIAQFDYYEGYSFHRISIFYREGRYYLFDSENTSLEDNYDPRYSARTYDSLESLSERIQEKCRKALEDSKNTDISYDQVLTFIDLRSAPTTYLSAPDEESRLTLINLNLLSKSLPPALFNKLFDKSNPILSSNDIAALLKVDPRTFRRLRPDVLSHVKEIDISGIPLDEFDCLAILRAASPDTIILGRCEALSNAYFRLGMEYERGDAIPKNINLSIKYLELASGQKHRKACVLLAKIYSDFMEKGYNKDHNKATHYYKLASELGDMQTQYYLGAIYEKEGNHRGAARYFELAAKQGDKEAQYSIGIKYYYGEGVIQSDEKAVHYFGLAAMQGNDDALNSLERMVNQDGNKDAKLELDKLKKVKFDRLKIAADQGDMLAQYDVGLKYYDGEGIKQNLSEAIRYFKLAAEKGDKFCQYQLGRIYAYDINPANFKLAVQYFKLAADQGDKDAEESLKHLTAQKNLQEHMASPKARGKTHRQTPGKKK